MILLHVLIALSSIACATWLFISPSQSKLLASYILIALTLGSGTYLVLTKPAHILQTCLMGLVYVGATVGATISARQRLLEKIEI